MSPLSTKEVAKTVGVGHRTLELWIRQGKIRPKTIVIGNRRYRLWSAQEIERVHRVKEKTYRKGRGRKKRKT
jgi:excisionase family DNA binding protein